MLRRLAGALLLLWLVLTITFALIRLAPGDPATFLVPPSATAADAARIRAELGLDRSLLVQYAHWGKRLLRGDLGESFSLRQPVSTALRDEFLRDGRVTLVNSSAEADATLTLTLSDYHRDVATVRPGDTGLARTFTLTLGATATLHDNRAGRDLFTRRPVDAGRDAYTDSGQLQSEYQSLPLLAGALAKKISHAALDVW